MSSVAARKVTPARLNSDEFLAKAQQMVVDNFNAHRKPDKVPELTLDDISVVWFAKVLGGWRCNIDSTVARGLLWRVTYAGAKEEIYLDVYTKLNNIKISLGAEEAA